MKGDPLPEGDHVVRYCRGSTIDDDGRPNAGSFMLEGHDYLSVGWIEQLAGGTEIERISSYRSVVKLKFRKSGKLAVLKVGTLTSHVRERTSELCVLRVLHEPEDFDAHAGIYDTAIHDEQKVAQVLTEVIERLYPAVA